MNRRKFISSCIAVAGCAIAYPRKEAQAYGEGFPPGSTIDNVQSIYVDLSKLKPGQAYVSNLLKDSPILYVVRRTPEEIEEYDQNAKYILYRYFDAMKHEIEQGKVPKGLDMKYRSFNPEYFVVWGMCTHLGCGLTYSPPGDEFGWAGKPKN